MSVGVGEEVERRGHHDGGHKHQNRTERTESQNARTERQGRTERTPVSEGSGPARGKGTGGKQNTGGLAIETVMIVPEPTSRTSVAQDTKSESYSGIVHEVCDDHHGQ